MSDPNYSDLDQQQIIQRVFDEGANRLKVDTGAVINLEGELEVAISDTAGDSVKVGDNSGNYLKVNSDGSINVNSSGGGSSTVKIEDSSGNSLNSTSGSLDVNVSNISIPVTGDFYPATQPISGSVSVSNFPSTQDVSGTVTSNIGITGGLALDSSLSSIITNTTLSNKNQILAANDVTSTFTWSDYGLSTQRVASIAYTSSSVLSGHTATKTFNYTLVTGTYRLDTIVWSYT